MLHEECCPALRSVSLTVFVPFMLAKENPIRPLASDPCVSSCSVVPMPVEISESFIRKLWSSSDFGDQSVLEGIQSLEKSGRWWPVRGPERHDRQEMYVNEFDALLYL